MDDSTVIEKCLEAYINRKPEKLNGLSSHRKLIKTAMGIFVEEYGEKVGKEKILRLYRVEDKIAAV